MGFDTGKERQTNPDYNSITLKIWRLRKKVDGLEKDSESARKMKTQIEALDKQRKSLPSKNVQDPHYKRIYYSRYADDTLIGVIGSKAEAQAIMDQVKEFLKNQLKLPIAEEKSTLKHATQGMIFLGYEVRTYSSDKVMKMTMGKRHTKRRTLNQKIDLYVPEERIRKFCQAKGYGDYNHLEFKQRPYLQHLSDYEILSTYNAELRGLANYYAWACDAKGKLNRLEYIFRVSLWKTLAGTVMGNPRVTWVAPTSY